MRAFDENYENALYFRKFIKNEKSELKKKTPIRTELTRS